MTQIYSNPKRESDPYSLPDVEVFEVTADEIISSDVDSIWYDMFCERADELKQAQFLQAEDYENQAANELAGFYYWACSPGCLPDGDPIGPFDTEADAIADAQSESWQFEDEE